MPTYSYDCQECSTRFTVRKAMSERDADTFCPDCGSDHTRRLLSAVAVFSTAADGQRRAIAGAPSCAGCGMAATGCTSCGPR